MRGLCREFGVAVSAGAAIGLRQIGEALGGAQLPPALHPLLQALLAEVREFEQRIEQIERELAEIAKHSTTCQNLLSVPGIGLLSATALVAATKRGDRYLRTLFTHGARSVLNAARLSQRRGRALDPLRSWALGIARRSHHNKANCALANKLARICFGVLRDAERYLPGRLAPLTVIAV